MRKVPENILFLLAISIIFLFGVLTFTKTETLISETENRSLNTFKHFTIESFIDGSFQDNFEAALSDQFVFSEQIRTGYSGLVNNLSVINADSICANHYLELTGSVDRRRGTFNCDDHIIYYPEPLTEAQAEIVSKNIQNYNRINNLTDAYYYFINDSSTYDFEKNSKVIDYNQLLKRGLTGKYHLASFDFSNYDAYTQYFYKTDHHWDYRGSYQGYKEIIKLLDAGAPLTPTKTFTNHENFFGSHAKNTQNFTIEEEFAFYLFDLPKHTTVINGLPDTYGNQQDYINHNYEYDKAENYYAYVYGKDEGEIVYNFNQPEKDNLLIISNSYSNAVNELIASHFNKTYIIDLRRYKTVFGKDFEINQYLKNHNINKTLFIMSATFIRDTDTNQGLEF